MLGKDGEIRVGRVTRNGDGGFQRLADFLLLPEALHGDVDLGGQGLDGGDSGMGG